MEVLVLQDDNWDKELAPIFANTELEVIWRIKVDWETFEHPRRCVYLLGAEDSGLSKQAIAKCHFLIKFKSQKSLNVSVAGSIVLYDRGINKPRS